MIARARSVDRAAGVFTAHPGRHDDLGLEAGVRAVRDGLLHADDHRVRAEQMLGMRLVNPASVIQALQSAAV